MQYKLFITYMEFIIILFLLVLNGVFAMYEIALVSSSKARLETLAGKGNKRAKGVLKQLEEPEKFLSTIQIGITLIGIVSGAFGGVAIADNVAPLFASIPGVAPYAKDLAMITTVAIITYLSLIIGELVPKSIALSNPERYATLLSPVMILLTKVSYPFVCLLSFSTKIVNKLIGLNNGEERPMTQEELKMILHQSSEQGVIDKEETEMLRDVFRFSDKRANELMTYRRDLVVLHPTYTRDEVLHIIREQHFSKYLLVEKGKDDIIGVVSVKDIILMLGNDHPLHHIIDTCLTIIIRIRIKSSFSIPGSRLRIICPCHPPRMNSFGYSHRSVGGINRHKTSHISTIINLLSNDLSHQRIIH